MSTTAYVTENPTPAYSSAGRSRIAFVISCLLFLNFFYFLVSSGRVRTIDEVSAEFQVESLARRGSADIPQAIEAKLFYGTIDRLGRPESPYPPGQALAMLPWYVAGQFAAKHLPGVPSGMSVVVSNFFLTGGTAFFSALAAALALCIFLRLGIAPRISLMAAGILALATPLAVYSGWNAYPDCSRTRRRNSPGRGHLGEADARHRRTHISGCPIRPRTRKGLARCGRVGHGCRGVCNSTAVEERVSPRQSI
jgi:hypothetical protein